ncbi:hypothetical protein MASR2M29_05680 [Spirochaetota bacterium]
MAKKLTSQDFKLGFLKNLSQLTPFLILLLSLVCIFLVAILVSSTEKARMKDRFIMDAADRYKLVKDAFSGTSHHVNALGRFIETDMNISETGFALFVKPTLDSGRFFAYLLLDLSDTKGSDNKLASLIKYSVTADTADWATDCIDTVLDTAEAINTVEKAAEAKTIQSFTLNKENIRPILVYCSPVIEKSVLYRPSVQADTAELPVAQKPPFIIMAFIDIENLVKKAILPSLPIGLTTIVYNSNVSAAKPLYLYETRIGHYLGNKLPTKDFFYTAGFNMAEISWLIRVQPSSAYAILYGKSYWFILGFGIPLSILLFLLVFYLKKEKAKAEKLAAIASQDYEAFFNVSMELFAIANMEGVFVKVNRQWTNILGYDREELLGQKYSNFIHPDDISDFETKVSESLRYGGASENVNRYRAKDGTYHYLEWRSSQSEDKKSIFIAGRDISDKIARQTKLEQNLKEKEVLLQEVHHRVKNNMQVISSLLNLEASRFDNSVFADAAKEAQGRIHTMAMVHEQLYSRDNLDKLDLGIYINDLAKFISEEYFEEDRSILVEAESVFIDLNTAIPCGLVLNELLTNAFKYGKNKDKALVSVTAGMASGLCAILVEDNGPGLPPDALEKSKRGDTLGLSLVNGLAQQLGGGTGASSR